MVYFLLLLFGHFVSDFLLQSDEMNARKKEEQTRIRALMEHVGIHMAVYALLVAAWLIWQQLLTVQTALSFAGIILIVGVIHFGIDLAKLNLDNSLASQIHKALIYLADQALHIAVIAIVLTVFNFLPASFTSWGEGFYQLLFEGITLSDFEKLLAMGILIILNTYGASYLIAILLQNLAPPESTTNTSVEERETEEKGSRSLSKITTHVTTHYPKQSINLGRYIGILERLLIMVFVINQALTSITVLVAMKSITRFKQFEDRRFAEYYLVGTLLSIVAAVFIGYAAVRVL